MMEIANYKFRLEVHTFDSRASLEIELRTALPAKIELHSNLGFLQHKKLPNLELFYNS